MKDSARPRKRIAKPATGNAAPLTDWLRDSRVIAFLGRPVEIKFRVLALSLTGTGSVAAIAKDFNLSRQAVERYVRRCRSAFGQTQQNVGKIDSANRA